MRGLLLCIASVLILNSCDTEDSNTALEMELEDPVVINKVALLQVDFLTYNFEGGTELEFEDNANFTITNEYLSPGDFGFIKLYYEEVDQLMFEGSIIWLGRGERSYPEMMEPSSDFPTEPNEFPLPPEEDFEIVAFGDSSNYPNPIPSNLIWEAIDNLTLVKDYRSANPAANINLFLYRPSVGIGDPADWDWIILLKN